MFSRMAPFFMEASSAAPSSGRPACSRPAWSETASEAARSSGRLRYRTPWALAKAGSGRGSVATSCMPKALARSATSFPMRPRPTIPSVLPRSSTPMNPFHPPVRVPRCPGTIPRATASSSASVRSATESCTAPNAALTTIPRARAAGRSMLSSPTPCLAMVLSRSADAITSAVSSSVPVTMASMPRRASFSSAAR